MIVLKCLMFILLVSLCNCLIPDKVYCANKECNGAISKAKTLLQYSSSEPEFISFKGNADATILMKSAGTNDNIWYATINGKSGFVNSKFLRESKIYVKKSDLLVTDLLEKNILQPVKVQQQHEVVDGTTLYSMEPEPSTKPVVEQNELIHEDSKLENTPKLQSLGQETILQEVIETNSQDLDPLSADLENAEEVFPLNSKQDSERFESGVDQQSITNLENRNDQQSIPILENKNDGINKDLQWEQNKPPLEEPTTGNPLQPNAVHIHTSVPPTLQQENFVTTSPEQGPPVIQDDQFPPIMQPPLVSQENSQLSPQQENIPQPLLQENVPHSLEQENIRPPLSQENIPQPITQENIPQPITQENIPPPLSQEHIPSPLLQEQVLPPLSQENIPQILNNHPSPNLHENIPHTFLQENDPLTFQQDTIPITQDQIPTNIKEETIPNDPPTELYDQPTGNIQEHLISSSKDSNTLSPERLIHLDESVSIMTENPPVIQPEIPIIPQDIFSSNSGNTNFPGVPVPENIDLLDNNFEKSNTKEKNYELNSSASVILNEDNTKEENFNKPNINIENDQVANSFTTGPSETQKISNDPNIQNEQPPNNQQPQDPSQLPEYTNSFTPKIQDNLNIDATPNPIKEISTEPKIDNKLPLEEIPLEITTSAPLNEENENGFLSNLYTSVADLFPRTTESPLKHLPEEPIVNIPNVNTKNENNINTADGEDEGFSVLKFIASTYKSMSSSKTDSSILFANPDETCLPNGYCEDGFSDQNNRLLFFLLTTASSILLFILGYYYLDNKRQDGQLVGMVNTLQRDLLCATKECQILKEELTSTKTKLAGIEDNSFGMDDMVKSLKDEIIEHQAQNDRLRNSLDDNEKLLRVSENTAMELQNTLGEVENTLSELLTERAHSEEHITELNDKIQAFEEELIAVSRDRDSFQLKFVSAESSQDELKKQKGLINELNELLLEAKNTIDSQKHEIIALKDCIKDVKNGVSDSVDANSLINTSEIKAQLAKALEDSSAFQTKYELVHKEKIRLDEELLVTKESLRAGTQHATEATTRLEVLGKYFQERESELLKELSTKEALWLSKQGESVSTIEKIESLQQEVQRYKEKCECLSRELAELESSRRTAIAELESQAHAAWLEARTARRDAAADRDAAAVLRRRLAAMAAPDAVPSPHRMSSPLEAGVSPSLPPVPGLPPPLPPLAFLPPALLPPLPRPPPLGRLPSPHPPRYNDRRYSPDSRYSPESRYSPDSVRYSPESRYSGDRRRTPERRSPYSSRTRRRSRERYEGRHSRQRVPDTETEYPSDNSRRSPPRRRYSNRSGPSSGSGCSSESGK